MKYFRKKFKNESVVKLSPSKMHRAYQPITAANNKLLKKRWDQRSYDLHRSKVSGPARTVHGRPRPCLIIGHFRSLHPKR